MTKLEKKKYEEDINLNQKYVYIVSLAHFFCDIAMGALPAILPFFILNYGMDYSAVAGFMFASSFL